MLFVCVRLSDRPKMAIAAHHFVASQLAPSNCWTYSGE
jgi:hypothetical protein